VSPLPLPAVRIHAARRADLDALVALEKAAFATDRISPRQWRRHLRSGSAAALVAKIGPSLAGAALLFFRRGSHVARLYSIAVDRGWRGHHVGERLLAAAERSAARRARCLRLEVREDNAVARRFYATRGYQPIGRRAGYYEDGADALRFEKVLHPE
jgi:ribosomal protein S18 acetylase RimI-like enzyme